LRPGGHRAFSSCGGARGVRPAASLGDRFGGHRGPADDPCGPIPRASRMAWLIRTAMLANSSSNCVRSSGSSGSAWRISRMQLPTDATATARAPTTLDVSRRSAPARRSARSRRSSPAARRAPRRRSVSIGSVMWRRPNRRRSPARRSTAPRRLVTRRSRAFITRRRVSSPFTVSSLRTTRLVQPGRSPADRCVRSARPRETPKVCLRRKAGASREGFRQALARRALADVAPLLRP
jgi:hypothetical protein